MSTSLKRDLLIVTCAVSAGVHAALVRDHLHESGVTGGGFIAATVVLLALIVLLHRRPDSRLVLVVTALSFVGLLVGYAFAVTTGIPALHPDVEPVDRLALTTKIVETLGLAIALDLVRGTAAAFTPSFLHQPEGARS